MADLIWHNAGQNRMVIYLMDGHHVLTVGPDIPDPIGDGWSVPSTGDFNYDGMADVLWYNSEKNSMAVWLMNGTHLLAPGPDIPGPPGDGWAVITASDFNYDGMADVLWHNAEKNLMAVWLMNGTKLLAPGPWIPGPPGDGWNAVTAADFNYDGFGDVLWNNSGKGLMAVWLMNGTRLVAPGPLVPGPLGDGWNAVTAGDFNYDGMADVVWHNTSTNSIAIGLMNGTKVLVPGPALPGFGGTGWAIHTPADFNYDGMADVLRFNAGKSVAAIWLMNGTRVLIPKPEIPAP